MTADTSSTVPTRHVETAGIRFAYRRWGKPSRVPLVFLNYYSANLEDWDPQVADGLAAEYEVILFDNAGVANSGGETPGTVAEMTRDVLAFCDALGLKKINVVGFSLGGMIAQQMALEHPDRVNRIILLGTGPRGGEGMTFTELSADERADPAQFLLGAFFSPSDASQAAGRAYLDRQAARTRDLDRPVSPKTAEAQLHAIREWGVVPPSDRYATLHKIKHPTLVVHGSKDIVVQPINAFILAQHLPNAQLIMYPDSSHGAHYQHADLFLQHAKLFLSQTKEARNKALALEAFDTLFNQRDYAAAERFWSPRYIQHSAHITPGREGLFELVKAAPPILKYEPGLVVAEGDYVILHGRFSGIGLPVTWIVADIVRIEDGILAEHWDVIQDEATREQSKCGRPMFGETFPVYAAPEKTLGARSTHTIQTQGAAIRISESGSGAPACVFLHYWGGSGRTWDDVIDRIDGRARCVAVDQRGWGESIATDGRYDLAAMADDVQGVVAALGLQRYVLVGHSMGGKVAQIVAARCPASLLGLVLVAPAPPTPMPVPEAQRGGMLDSYGSREGVQQALMVLAGSPLSDVLRERVIEDTLRGAPGAKREWTERGMIEDVSTGLEAVVIPTVVVIGDRDRVEHESALRQAFGRFLPHASFRVLAGVGHLSPLERPGELAAACLDLLATVSAAGTSPNAASVREGE